MISYPVYKIVHYLGIFALLTVLGTSLARGATGSESEPWRRTLAAGHGVALFLVLLGGFGMLARLEITHDLTLPGWVWAKLTIWTLLAGLFLLARRSPVWSGRALLLVPVLATLAGWIALFKPL